MHFLSALLVIASVGANAAGTTHHGVETHRVLRAATKKADFYRRGVRITTRFETEMAYVDNENVWTDASTFASQVKVASQKPVLNLEEHEHHLQGVECTPDAMKLHFVDTSSARDAKAACHGKHGGFIITSHQGCNEEGERSVYRVNDVSFAQDGEALEISVMETTWQEAFDHVNVTFGHTTDHHIYRRHADLARILGKRQGRVDIPVDTPDDVNTAEFDLSADITDTTFGAVNFLDIIGDVVPVPGPPINAPIELGCTTCTTKGQLALSQGAFNIDASQIDLIPDLFQGGDDAKEISSVITGGFMELVATGVGARLELFAHPASSGAFEVALFSLPIVGFTIPGIGKAGALFEPRVRFDFEVSAGVEIRYGLDINVPDGSSLRVELTDLSTSSLTGFQDTSFTPLPVSVNTTDIKLLLGLAFKPTIPVGFEFFDQLRAEVTASLDLPRLNAKLSTATPENCGGISNDTAPGAPFSNTTAHLSTDPATLGPLMLVEANASISCDVAFNVALPLLQPPFNSVRVSQNVFQAVVGLISDCAAPDGAFDSLSSLVIPPPMRSEATPVVPIMNATAPPAFDTTISGTAIPTSETLASSTSLATWPLNTTSTAMLNFTMSMTWTSQPTETPCESTSTTTLTNTSYITSRITLETTVTPPAKISSLDSTVVFTLFSPSSEEVAMETASSGSESLVQESRSSAEEATSTAQAPATSTPEASSQLPSSTPPSPALSSSSTLQASPSIGESSAPPASSSAIESSAIPSSSIANASSAVSSAPPVSTTAAAPAQPAPAESLLPPAAVVTMGAGFLVPSNANALPAQQTDITAFTGAATKASHVPEQKILLGLVMGIVGFWAVGELA